jgi:hypothetical protein
MRNRHGAKSIKSTPCRQRWLRGLQWPQVRLSGLVGAFRGTALHDGWGTQRGSAGGLRLLWKRCARSWLQAVFGNVCAPAGTASLRDSPLVRDAPGKRHVLRCGCRDA